MRLSDDRGESFIVPGDRLRTPEVDSLIAALLALETPDETYAFLQDVATVREIRELAQRFAVAKMLAAGAHYTDIQESTGASATTIARVNKALNYGADGYATALGRLAERD